MYDSRYKTLNKNLQKFVQVKQYDPKTAYEQRDTFKKVLSKNVSLTSKSLVPQISDEYREAMDQHKN